MARCIPTTKTCNQISDLLHLGREWIQAIDDDELHTHVIHRVRASQKDDFKSSLRSIGAKFIKFENYGNYNPVYGDTFLNCYFALPITREELEAKNAREAEQRRFEERVASTKRDVRMLASALGCRSTDEHLDGLANRLCTGALDVSKMISAYVTNPKSPVGKDEMRIYDIIRKSQPTSGCFTFCVANADHWKMRSLATQMNNKIKDEDKRQARHDACLRYGLTRLARCFT